MSAHNAFMAGWTRDVPPEEWNALRCRPASLRRARKAFPRYVRYRRVLRSRLIPSDLLPSFNSCLSLRGLSVMFALLLKRKVYYTEGTIAHNGPLFWRDVAERSLVKAFSSTVMCHPAISIPFHLLLLDLFFCSAPFFVNL